MPQAQVDPSILTPALVTAEAGRKKKYASTGMDGVSRADVLSCDACGLDGVVSMFDGACLDGSWPSQVTNGRLASLAKIPGARETNQFRPTTVFSMLSRIFSSLHARQLLAWADRWCHPDVFSNRQHHCTTHLWRTLNDSIQSAQDQSLVRSGSRRRKGVQLFTKMGHPQWREKKAPACVGRSLGEYEKMFQG